jgi:hypothetical protein
VKPTSHLIPLTASERKFVSKALATAVDRGLTHVTSAANIIAVWPEGPHGMFEIVLDDVDRECVYGILRPGQLESFRMRRWPTLHYMFEDYLFDRDTVFRHLRERRLHIPDVVSKCIDKGYFGIAQHYAFTALALQAAFDAIAAAGFGTLRREPAGGRRKYDRLYIDWHDDMWKPPYSRRRPLRERETLPERETLSKIESDAIGGMA